MHGQFGRSARLQVEHRALELLVPVLRRRLGLDPNPRLLCVESVDDRLDGGGKVAAAAERKPDIGRRSGLHRAESTDQGRCRGG
ncbi:MAG: hypothetical protein MI785_05255 [Kiloniellales bacterium]|nr:hypothetical protein [Kiloniellales bacterium]